MGWTQPRTFTAGEIIPATDLNLYVRDNLAFLKERMQVGNTTVTPVAGVPTSVTVAFPIPFESPPRVMVSASTTVIGGTVLGVSADEFTNVSFRATVTRTTAVTTTLVWLAVQQDD